MRAFVPDGVARDQLEVEIVREDTRRSLARGENDDVWRSPPIAPGLYRIALQGPGVLRATSEVVVQPDREVYVDLQAGAAQPAWACRTTWR